MLKLKEDYCTYVHKQMVDTLSTAAKLSVGSQDNKFHSFHHRCDADNDITACKGHWDR